MCWVIVNTLLYFTFATVLLFGCTFIPSTDTGSNVWRVIFYRGDDVYNTTYFPWSTLVYYFLMNMVGHAYVNSSNMNLKRKSLIRTQSSNYRDFCLVPVFAPIFWILSTIIVLRSQDSISSTHNTTYSNSKFSYLNVFLWNLLQWQIPYFVGLQFTHTDQYPFTMFVLSPDAMKKWPAILWIAAVILVLVALAIMGYFIAMYIIAGVFVPYLVWGLLIVAFMIVKTLCLRKSHKIHVHHYTCGMMAIALIGY